MISKYYFKLWVIVFALSTCGSKAQNTTFQVGQIMTVVANSDFVSMGEGATEVINVLNNDYGLLSGVKELVIIQEPQYATISIEDFNVIYTPDQGFIGTDEFKYKVCSNAGECDEAVVTVVVEDIDFVPIANRDAYSMYRGEDLLSDILANDNSLFDLPINVTVIEELKNGTSGFDGNWMLDVRFNVGFTGKDSLQYQVCDVEGDCAQAWVVIEVVGDGSEKIFIPQGISPNGDEANDYFYIPDLEGFPLKIVIFDKFGVVVFKSNQYKNNWGGRSNMAGRDGELLERGHYYYVLKETQTNREYSGFIYLNY